MYTLPICIIAVYSLQGQKCSNVIVTAKEVIVLGMVQPVIKQSFDVQVLFCFPENVLDDSTSKNSLKQALDSQWLSFNYRGILAFIVSHWVANPPHLASK